MNALILILVVGAIAVIYLWIKHSKQQEAVEVVEPLLPIVSRPFFGYWAVDYTPVSDDQIRLKEVGGEVNMAWLGSWACDPNTLITWHISQMKAGLANNIQAFCNTIDVLVYNEVEGKPWSKNPDAVANLRRYLQALMSEDLLKYVKGLYPVDEPNIPSDNGQPRLTEQEVIETNQLIREVLARFLIDIPLVVIYSGLDGSLPAIDTYDKVGGDNYNIKSRILGQYVGLLGKIRPNQQLVLVPPGHDPYKVDPNAFLNLAQRFPDRVWAICAYQYGLPGGVAVNGMREVYQRIGKLCAYK